MAKNFGVSSPRTMRRNVITAKASTRDVVDERRRPDPDGIENGLSTPVNAGSPTQPRARLARVMSCVADR
jgi:hypothetical protein